MVWTGFFACWEELGKGDARCRRRGAVGGIAARCYIYEGGRVGVRINCPLMPATRNPTATFAGNIGVDSENLPR